MMAANNVFVFLIAMIALISCGLSVLNHFRYERLSDLKNLEEEEKSVEVPSRIRRGLHLGSPNEANEASDDDSYKKKNLFADIAELKAFIREEFNQSIQSLIDNELKVRLSEFNHSMKCSCPTPTFSPAREQNVPSRVSDESGKTMGNSGLRGPPGPPGPPGPKGDRGLGLYPPKFKNKSIDLLALVGESKIFTCVVFGNPLPKVSWWHTNVSDMEIKETIDHQESVITSHLHVKNITWTVRGIITCSASNILGTTKATGRLTVHAPPIIYLPSQPIIGVLGMTIKFPRCIVSFPPPANITWQRIFLNFPQGRTFTRDGILQISNLQVKDEGYYECIAKNYLGTTKKYIQLRARPLEFTKKPSFYVYRTNSSVTLSCAAYGVPGEIFGTWSDTVNGNALPSTKKFTKKNEYEISLLVNQAGKYQCSISNNLTTIKSYTEVELFNLESSVVNSKQVHTLGKWMKEANGIGKYKLCWSGTQHGFNTSKFLSRCAGKPNTISILKSDDNSVFGGYTDLPWEPYKPEKDYKHYTSQVRFFRPRRTGSYTYGYIAIKYQHQWGTICDDSFDDNDALVLCRMMGYIDGVYHSGRYKTGDGLINGKLRTSHTIWLTNLRCGGNERNIESCKHSRWGNTRCTHVEDVGIKCRSEIKYRYSLKTFVFALQPRREIRIPVRNKEKAICSIDGNGICFGDMELFYSDKSIGYTIGKSFRSNSISSLSGANSSISDIEVHYKI